jgi:hypothetical protein
MSESNEPQERITPEQKHASGYAAQPQTPEEVVEWEAEQVWDSDEQSQQLKS